MGLLHSAIDLLHIDKYLEPFATAHPTGVYLLLVTIVFCETGLVVTPFLPGDSLLFAVGAVAAACKSPGRCAAMADVTNAAVEANNVMSTNACF